MMYQLKSEFKFDVEKAKRYAIDKSDQNCYLISSDESRLQLIINKHQLIVDFNQDIIYHESVAIHDAITLKKAIRRQ